MKTLLTCALPYANGELHIGHFAEYVLADIHVRYLRSAGEEVLFLCADDTHGAPIEMNAMKEGIPPEEFVLRYWHSHRADLDTFNIDLDFFGSTHTAENKEFSELIYGRAKAKGSIARKEIEQPFDEGSGRWLSDRFIRGTCPHCGATDQYGDGCERCNATYTPRELKDARSAISGGALTWRKSEHLFFVLSKHEQFLRKQLALPGFVNSASASQLNQFFDRGLADWDITRDGPYFGFLIPGEVDKYFYVWLDAPIGYIGATAQWSKASPGRPDALTLWSEQSETRIIHVIGKDIVYFHCLFWPAVLQDAKLKLPAHVQVHGHLTVNGAKMSKSRGSLISARHFANTLPPETLRYYFASLLGDSPEDLDLSLVEFRERVNAGLINNLLNLANRSLSILGREPFARRLAAPAPELGSPLVGYALARVPEVAKAYRNFGHRDAVRLILEIGAETNRFLTKTEPWKLVKDNPGEAQRILSEVCEVVYILATLLEPIVPKISAGLFAQLNRPPATFRDLERAAYPLLDRTLPIGEASPLLQRLEEAAVSKLVVPEEA